jgi:hypothetical protein
MIKTAPKKKLPSMIADVEPEKSFWLNDGRMLKNLKELAQALETMDGALWSFHANAEKNDFASWVEDVFGQKQLGSALRKTKSARTAAKRINEKIESPKFWSFLM